MTVKRRTVWMDDENWDAIRRRADERSMSPSQWLKALAFDNVGIPVAVLPAFRGPILREDVDDIYGGVAPLGRTVIEPGGFNTRPFTPVPKVRPKR